MNKPTTMTTLEQLKEEYVKWYEKDFGQDGEIGWSPSNKEITNFWLNKIQSLLGEIEGRIEEERGEILKEWHGKDCENSRRPCGLESMDKFYQKVKEGGYDFERLGNPKSVKERDNALLLDPLAWQALGKAEGWDSHHPLCFMVALDSKTNCQCKAKAKTQQEWKRYWHLFIDHLAQGGTPDKFFEELLASYIQEI